MKVLLYTVIFFFERNAAFFSKKKYKNEKQIYIFRSYISISAKRALFFIYVLI